MAARGQLVAGRKAARCPEPGDVAIRGGNSLANSPQAFGLDLSLDGGLRYFLHHCVTVGAARRVVQRDRLTSTCAMSTHTCHQARSG
jgi:hypothetical protein